MEKVLKQNRELVCGKEAELLTIYVERINALKIRRDWGWRERGEEERKERTQTLGKSLSICGPGVDHRCLHSHPSYGKTR